eukprot:scaffold11368_cov74-Skeletonema_marinoi.AAC.6
MEVRMRQAEARAKMAEDRANRLEQENNAMKAKLEKQKPRVRRVCNIVRSKLKKEEYACRMGQMIISSIAKRKLRPGSFFQGWEEGIDLVVASCSVVTSGNMFETWSIVR